jgi:ABC-type uncharacterized transport system substrate-binding protein
LDRRNALIGLGCVGIALTFRAAVAQRQGKVWRVGFLVPGSEASFASRFHALKQRLNQLGYVDGKNVVFEYRWADGSYERLSALAAELVRLKVDIVVAQTTPATRATQRATAVIPIVMVSVGDPVGTGLVASLARPGGNVTGVGNFVGDTSKKQLDLLMTIVPKLSTVAVLINPANQSTPAVLRSFDEASQATNVRALPIPAQTSEQIEKAFAVMKQQRAQALVLLGDGFFLQQRAQIAELAAKIRIPASYNLREYVEVGGLMSYGANALDITRRAAVYVDKILNGASPADLPVEQPNTLELVINLKTAKALQLAIPQELLLRADEVIA